MNTHAPLFLALKKVPFTPGTAHEMRRRGTWTWLVKGTNGHVWIDIPGLQKFMRSRAPVWRNRVDLPGLIELAGEFDFQEAAKS